jgi:hypothetical protein
MQEEFKLGDTLLLDRTNGAGMTVRYLLPRTDSHSNQATVQIKLGSEGSKLASAVLSKHDPLNVLGRAKPTFVLGGRPRQFRPL